MLSSYEMADHSVNVSIEGTSCWSESWTQFRSPVSGADSSAAKVASADDRSETISACRTNECDAASVSCCKTRRTDDKQNNLTFC